MPCFCELYPGICHTTEEKHGKKTSVRVVEKCQFGTILCVRMAALRVATFAGEDYAALYIDIHFVPRSKHAASGLEK